jgi:hypothetical protein
MDFENCQPEESETNAWRAMPIAWEGNEGFAPPLICRQVAVRLLLWNGVEAQWVNPILSAKDKSASWTGSLNSAADFKMK